MAAVVPGAIRPVGTGGAGGTVPDPSSRQQAFAAAAREFHVPVQVLLAVSYAETQWEENAGKPRYAGGYGPMNLTDLTRAILTADKFTSALRTPSLLSSPALHDLAPAAALAHVDAATAETGDAQNIRAGAALLASYQKQYGGGQLPAGAAGWYVSVARYSQSAQPPAAQSFADGVYATIRSGAERTTSDGQHLLLPPDAGVLPDRASISALHLSGITVPPPDPVHDPAQISAPECPADLHCIYSPDGYWQYGSKKSGYGDHDIANRPANLPIRYVTLHDNEETADTTLWLFHDPAYVASAAYEVTSAGQVIQLQPVEDIAWDTANESFYQHSVGIEQEGFALYGHTWYTAAMYRATAELTRYLAARFHIPLNRSHILGHDSVPCGSDSCIASQHWDPGPYWDWAKFMSLAGAPVTATASPASDVVTIDPGYQANKQVVTGCPGIQDLTPYPGPYHGAEWPNLVTQDCPASYSQAQPSQPVSFVWLRTAPSASAPLLADPYLHPDGSPGTTETSDWGDKAVTGQQYVVAGRQGDWTAIWYAGRQAWFHNPPGTYRGAVPASAPMLITPKAGKSSIPVYVTAYPEASAYPASFVQRWCGNPPRAGCLPRTQSPATKYTIGAGQQYVAAGPAFNSDWYNAYNMDGSAFMDRTDFAGQTKYYLVTYNHRMAFVNADDADVVPSRR
jgi:N-acetyl-anhydromuramyl-L-alanine amidase AmpD